VHQTKTKGGGGEGIRIQKLSLFRKAWQVEKQSLHKSIRWATKQTNQPKRHANLMTSKEAQNKVSSQGAGVPWW
jgi:hypothetical protein